MDPVEVMNSIGFEGTKEHIEELLGKWVRDFVADDITFCISECDNKDCERHKSNIKHPEYPHSVSFLKGTELCPLNGNRGLAE